MSSPRFASALALTLLVALVAPLGATEPAAQKTPDTAFLSPVPAVVAAGLCPRFFCPIYYPDYCTCDWIECPSGEIVCGVWDGRAAATASSAPMSPAFDSTVPVSATSKK